MEVFLANIDHLESLSILFDQYRVFYNQSSDIEAAKDFISDSHIGEVQQKIINRR